MQRKFKLTKTSIESKALPPGADETNSKGNPVKDRTYWDTELPGFGIRVGRPRLDPDSGRELPPVRTFIAQKDIDGRTRRVTVGRYGVYTVEAARKRAMALLVQMNEGIDPTAARRAEKVASMTLAEAIDLHRFTPLLMDLAKSKRREGETIEARAARLLSEDPIVRDAYAATQGL
ncbi:MAG: Arm DNA-binding domain-containing protein [Planctomycetota bacterium]